jgi:hypothetical protein
MDWKSKLFGVRSTGDGDNLVGCFWFSFVFFQGLGRDEHPVIVYCVLDSSYF